MSGATPTTSSGSMRDAGCDAKAIIAFVQSGCQRLVHSIDWSDCGVDEKSKHISTVLDTVSGVYVDEDAWTALPDAVRQIEVPLLLIKRMCLTTRCIERTQQRQQQKEQPLQAITKRNRSSDTVSGSKSSSSSSADRSTAAKRVKRVRAEATANGQRSPAALASLGLTGASADLARAVLAVASLRASGNVSQLDNDPMLTSLVRTLSGEGDDYLGLWNLCGSSSDRSRATASQMGAATVPLDIVRLFVAHRHRNKQEKQQTVPAFSPSPLWQHEENESREVHT